MKCKKQNPLKFKNTDIKIFSKKCLYHGFFSFVEYYVKHRLFSGGWSNKIRREFLECGNAGIILPYDHQLDKIILIEQIRIPALKTSITPWLLECIAGMQEKNETLEELVRREAKEEAGIVIQRCYYALSYLSSPGSNSERIYVYIGEINTATVTNKGLFGSKKENEDTRVHIINRNIAYKWIKLGIIDNAATIIALQWLQLNYIMLTNLWK